MLHRADENHCCRKPTAPGQGQAIARPLASKLDGQVAPDTSTETPANRPPLVRPQPLDVLANRFPSSAGRERSGRRNEAVRALAWQEGRQRLGATDGDWAAVDRSQLAWESWHSGTRDRGRDEAHRADARRSSGLAEPGARGQTAFRRGCRLHRLGRQQLRHEEHRPGARPGRSGERKGRRRVPAQISKQGPERRALDAEQAGRRVCRYQGLDGPYGSRFTDLVKWESSPATSASDKSAASTPGRKGRRRSSQ